MPDQADVEQTLAALIADALYPAGVDRGSSVENVCRVYRGWPVSGALDSDLARGVIHVTVQSVSGVMRDRTRFSQEWQGVVPVPTMRGRVSGEVVRFEGEGGTGQVAGILVDNRAYAYRLQAGDTSALVAAALAGLIRNDRPALAIGSEVLVVGGRGLLVRVVRDGEGGRELRRQESVFRVTFWCPDPGTRDRIVPFIELALAERTFIDVDGWACRVRLSGGSSTDEGSAGSAWRRDLLYSIEYPTVAPEVLPAMLFGLADVNEVRFIG